MKRIIIRHMAGSKANQTDFFLLEETSEITFGRDASANVKYDAERDDLVSRSHAQIKQDRDNPTLFTITDLNSRNGTFINKSRINSPTRINHGDAVQLGRGGPEFVFELDPPPTSTVAPTTRLAADPVTRIQTATREAPRPTATPSEPKPHVSEDAKTTSRPEGRLTSLERRIIEGQGDLEARLSEEKQLSHKQLVNLVAGLLGFVILLAGVFAYREILTHKQMEATAAQANAELQELKGAQNVIDKMTPQEIAAKYSASTVKIESIWELVDTQGRKLYQTYLDNQPIYIKSTQNNHIRIEPLLTYDSGKGSYQPISGSAGGSGFVIHNQGFILTNRHVAAPWINSPCILNPNKLEKPGKLWDIDKYKYTDADKYVTTFTKEDLAALCKWQPQKSRLLIIDELTQGKRKEQGGAEIEGRHVKLDVTFPNASLPFPARMVRVSDHADVALLKIDTLDALNYMDLDSEAEVRPGDAVTVLGYPAISPEAYAEIKSKEPNNFNITALRSVPYPTVTSGLIGRVFKANQETTSGDIYYNFMGDVYQLTINATGSGNSGGPLFNDKGKVIGIFTYKSNDRDGTSITFAIPIKYGLDLKFNKPTIQQ